MVMELPSHLHIKKCCLRQPVLQVIVNGMRVRIKLDEERLMELIQGMDASAVPGLMRHLGDVASLSFAPYQNGEPLHS